MVEEIERGWAVVVIPRQIGVLVPDLLAIGGDGLGVAKATFDGSRDMAQRTQDEEEQREERVGGHYCAVEGRHMLTRRDGAGLTVYNLLCGGETHTKSWRGPMLT